MIETRFRVSSTLKRLIINTGWLFVLRLIRLVFAFFVGIWLARYLGPERFGALSYALAFVGLFAPFAHLGLNGPVVREIVNDPDRKEEILGTTFLLRLFGGLFCLAAATFAIMMVRPGDALTQRLVAIIAFGLVFSAFECIDIWFQSQVQVKYAVYAKSTGLVIANLAKIYFILAAASLVAFAWVSALEIMVAAVGLLIVYRYRGYLVGSWRFSLRRARSLLGISWPMILSGTLWMIYLRIDQVMLREMVSEEAVGIYSTAVRISEVWYFLPVIVTTSLFPELVKSKQIGEGVYRSAYQKVYDFLAWTSMPVVLALTFLAGPVIRLLYGDAFAGGGIILAILIWSSPFAFMRDLYGKWLVSEELTKFFMLAHGSGAVFNVLLNLYLIPRFGGVGAAIATLVSYTVGGYLICFVHPKTRIAGIMMTKALIAPARWLSAAARRRGSDG
jgi:PST family polysaccharide transporter